MFQVDEQLSHFKFDACEVKYETRAYLLQGFKLQMSVEGNKLDCTVCVDRGYYEDSYRVTETVIAELCLELLVGTSCTNQRQVKIGRKLQNKLYEQIY